MENYHKIAPLGGVKNCPDPGRSPEIIYPRLDQLVINEEYQRELSKPSLRQITRMAKGWDWSSFKTPNVAATEDPNLFEVIDGQHTAIAAATNGNIPILPCLLVPAATLREKAKGFLGVNLNKIGLTKAVIYNAQLAAGDELATSVHVALTAAGCRVLPFPSPDGKYAAGDILALGSLMMVCKAKGGGRLKELLEIAVRAKAAPVSAATIKALDLCLPQQASAEVRDRVSAVLAAQGPARLEIIAKSRTPAGERAYVTLADMIAELAKLPAKRLGKPRKRAAPEAMAA